MQNVNRRAALKILGAAGASFAVGPFWGCAHRTLRNAASPAPRRELLTVDGRDFNPIDRTVPDIAPRLFTGDNPDRSHGILWNTAGYINRIGGRVPEPTERVPLVIVGGGMSGAVSAYLHRQHSPVILERADRFGGNSRGESWRGTDYSLGAAYFMEQDPGSELFALCKEAGIHDLCRVKADDDPVAMNGQWFWKFWEGETDPKAKKQFEKLAKYFSDLFHAKDGLVFPEMPFTNEAGEAALREFDKENFLAHLERKAGGKLHPHIHTLIEHYCWSTLGATMTDLSAAGGLNAFASEFGKVYVPPGGNAALVEQFLKRTAETVPAANFRPGCIVFNVQVVSDGVHVSYEDAAGKPRTIHAKAVIMSCPKFVVKHILNGMEPERVSAIAKLKYHSYLVANVMLKGGAQKEFYDLYLLGNGKLPKKSLRDIATEQKATDVVLATYAKPRGDVSVLTLYRNLPYDNARGEIFSPDTFSQYHAEFTAQLKKEILPLVGKREEDILDLRISRWGHPIPVGSPGFHRDGTYEAIRKPFRERVFFVEQDNWMLPAFETCALEALHFAPEVRKLL